MTRILISRFIAGAALTLAAAVAAASPCVTSGMPTVPAGQRRCIDSSCIATTKVSVEGFVVSGHKVKFILLGKPNGAADFTQIADSGPDPVSSFTKTITPQTNPGFFPGTFRFCARDPADKPSTDSLKILVDQP